jgi:N-acetyl-anhydromuramyl-L-alanine amidase AmpD
LGSIPTARLIKIYKIYGPKRSQKYSRRFEHNNSALHFSKERQANYTSNFTSNSFYSDTNVANNNRKNMIPNCIVIHHSASRPGTTVAEIDAWHKVRGFTLSQLGFYVGYHYVILEDGTCIQTRRDNEIGCHTIPNDGKIGICLTGNFMNYPPTQSQLVTLAALSSRIKIDYNIKYIQGHRDFSITECPGDFLYKNVLIDKISWLQKLINLILKKP